MGGPVNARAPCIGYTGVIIDRDKDTVIVDERIDEEIGQVSC